MPPVITPEQVTDLMRANPTVRLLDARTPGEYGAACRHRICGAQHVPLGDLPQRSGSFPKDRPLVVHCQGGTRPAIAASLLSVASCPRVINLAGGFSKWSAAGHPVERGIQAPVRHASDVPAPASR